MEIIDLSKDIILYHGSKSGIEGEIEATGSHNREHCDFGKGFYMGTEKMQAQSLVAKFPTPYYYRLSVKLSEIPNDNILLLDGKDWLYAVLASRGESKEFNKLKIAKSWINKLSRYDLIIGKIADDAMNDALDRFLHNGITDEGLIACLQHHQFGTQYVAKTNMICKKIEIIEEKPLKGLEADNARNYGKLSRREKVKLVDDMAYKYYGKGRLLAQIIEDERSKEKHKDEER